MDEKVVPEASHETRATKHSQEPRSGVSAQMQTWVPHSLQMSPLTGASHLGNTVCFNRHSAVLLEALPGNTAVSKRRSGVGLPEAGVTREDPVHTQHPGGA